MTLRQLQCWLNAKRYIHQHPKTFHVFHAISHASYLILVWWHGQTIYAIAALPAAVASICIMAVREDEDA